MLLISIKLGLGKETRKLFSAATEVFLPSNAHKYFFKKQQTSNTYVIKLEQLKYLITKVKVSRAQVSEMAALWNSIPNLWMGVCEQVHYFTLRQTKQRAAGFDEWSNKIKS